MGRVSGGTLAARSNDKAARLGTLRRSLAGRQGGLPTIVRGGENVSFVHPG